MVNPISPSGPSVDSINTTSKIQTSAQMPATSSVQPPAAQPQAEGSKSDVVELSYSAQAQLLRQKGMSIEQIALQLRLDVSIVTSFFPQSGGNIGTA